MPARPRSRLELSGTKVREILREGGRLPRQFTRPEIAEILRAHYSAGEARRPAPKRTARTRLHRLVHRALRRGQVDAGAGAAPRARGRARRSRSWTATRCGPTCRRASASRRRTATPTSAGSATWRGSLARNGVAAITAAISPYRRDAGRGARLAEADGVPVVEVYAEARSRPDGARREGPLQEGARAARSSTSPASPTRTSRRSRPTSSSAPTARPWARASAASSRRSRSAGCSSPGARGRVVSESSLPRLPEARGARPARRRRPRRALEARVAPRHRRAGARRRARGPPRDPRERRPVERRGFAAGDLDGVWLAIAAATPEVNRAGRRGRGGAARLRQRGGRPGAGVGLPGRRRAQGRRGGGGVHRGPGARARRPPARGARGGAARRRRRWVERRRRFARDRRRLAFPSSGADRRCSRS